MGIIYKEGINYSGGDGSGDSYTKEETNALLNTKAALSVSQAGANNYKAEITQGTDTFRVDEPTNNLVDMKWIDTEASHDTTVSVPTKDYVDTAISDIPEATDTEAGLVKLNTDEAIYLNTDGKLTVGGRLGQFPGGGIFYPVNRTHTEIGANTLAIADANNSDLPTTRSVAVVTGTNYNLRSSHAAGSTEYQIADNYVNRLTLCQLAGSRVAANETASYDKTVAIESVTINGAVFTPDSPAIGSTPIVVKVSETANPDSAISSIRVIGRMAGFCNLAIGQLAASPAGGSSGASVIVGQRVVSKSNANAIIGADIYNTGNGNAVFGRQHYSNKNRWLMAGTGHNNSQGRSESGVAFGQWSSIDANTLLAVGNGTSNTDRSNAFEVVNDGIILKSPNGTRFKVSVDDSGNLSATAV